MPKNCKINVALTGKTITIDNNGVILTIDISKDHIEIHGLNNDKNFCFMSTNNDKTVNRWKNVIDTLQIAIKTIKEHRKI